MAMRIEPGNMGRNVLRQASSCPCEAVLFRGPHADQLLAAPQRARSSCVWASGRGGALGGSRQQSGLGRGHQRIRLASWPVARANREPAAGSTTREARGRQGARHGALQATRRFQHNQSRVEAWSWSTVPSPRWDRSQRPTALPKDARQCPTGFGYINTDKTWHVTHTNSCLPDLANTG